MAQNILKVPAFRRALRGYAPEQVDAYLTVVQDKYYSLSAENEKLRDRLSSIIAEEKKRGVEEELRRHEIEEIREEAESLLRAARKEADSLVKNAEAEAAKMRAEADAESREKIARANEERERIFSETKLYAEEAKRESTEMLKERDDLLVRAESAVNRLRRKIEEEYSRALRVLEGMEEAGVGDEAEESAADEKADAPEAAAERRPEEEPEAAADAGEPEEPAAPDDWIPAVTEIVSEAEEDDGDGPFVVDLTAGEQTGSDEPLDETPDETLDEAPDEPEIPLWDDREEIPEEADGEIDEEPSEEDEADGEDRYSGPDDFTEFDDTPEAAEDVREEDFAEEDFAEEDFAEEDELSGEETEEEPGTEPEGSGRGAEISDFNEGEDAAAKDFDLEEIIKGLEFMAGKDAAPYEAAPREAIPESDDDIVSALKEKFGDDGSAAEESAGTPDDLDFYGDEVHEDGESFDPSGYMRFKK